MSIPPGLSGPLPVPDFFTRQFPAGIVIGSVFFGALSIVVILFAVVFARHKNKTRALWAMLGIIGVIYACSIVDYAFQTHVFLSMLHGRRICFANLCATIVNISTAINQIILVISVTYVILLINDCVVVWRAWTLWRRSKLVLVTSGVLILANITLSITSLVLFHKKPLLSTSQTGTELPIDFVLVFAISIAINFYTTVLVGIRTWQYWRAIRGTAGSLPLLFKLLLIIVESGFIYLILWTVFLCSLFPSTGPLFNFNFYLNCGVPYVAAMYPAAIFILVGIHKSAQDEIFTGTMLDSLSVPSGHAFSAPTWTVGPAMSTGQEGEMQLSVLSEPAPSLTSSSQNKIERGSVV